MRRHAKAPSAGSMSAAAQKRLGACVFFGLLLTGLILSVSSALALVNRPLIDEIEELGRVQGPVSASMTIDQSNGDIYVREDFGGVRRFDAAGNPKPFAALGTNILDGSEANGAADDIPLRGYGFFYPGEVAIDNSGTATDGTIYVAESEANETQVFAPDGTYKGSLSGGGDGVAVGSDGAVYVSNGIDQILRYVPSGDSVTDADLDSQISGVAEPFYLRLDSSDNVFAKTAGGALLKFTQSDFGTANPGTEVLSGIGEWDINPQTGHIVVSRETHLEEFDGAGTSLGPIGANDIGNRRVTGVGAYAAADYVYGAFQSGGILVFGPSVPGPIVFTGGATNLRASNADIHGIVNPNEATTSYQFEYVSDVDFQASGYANAAALPPLGASLPAGIEGQGVFYHLIDLSPGTRYHYRLVASNEEGGPNYGQGRSFRTKELATPFVLPDNRAYEMVSPVDKAGNDVVANPWKTRVAVDGTAASFVSLGAFDNAGGTGVGIEYLAERSSDGWDTHSLTPNQPPGNEILPGVENQTAFRGDFADDLTKGIIFARTPLTEEPNVATANNLYLRDNLRADVGPNPGGGAHYTLLTNSVNPLTKDESGFIVTSLRYIAHTPNFTHVLFEDRNNLTPETASEGPKAYEWTGGEVKLVGILPNGEPAPESLAGIGGSTVAGIGGGTLPVDHTLSQDGARIVFTGPPLGFNSHDAGGAGLYLRENGTVTIQINASERSVPDPGGPQPVHYRGSSADGSRIFFQTAEDLVDANDPPGMDLYMYDTEAPNGEHLSVISVDAAPLVGEGERASGVVGISDDGHYVYFSGEEALVSGIRSTSNVDGHGASASQAIYVWHDGELRHVGYANSGSSESTRSIIPDQGISGEKHSQITPSGTSMIFTTNAPNPPYINSTADPAAVCQFRTRCGHVYVYDYETDHLGCVSCDPGGGEPLADSFVRRIPLEGNFTVGPETFHQNRALTDDGKRVFFSTPAALLPQDSNGRWDAYQYEVATEKLSLLSTGQCGCNSFFVEATPNGDDAFIVTRESLVAIDHDRSSDLYDAKVGGGIAAQNQLPPVECEGDACQGLVSAPNDATPASASFVGAGVPQPKARKKRKHRKRHQHRRRQQQRHAAQKPGKTNTAMRG